MVPKMLKYFAPVTNQLHIATPPPSPVKDVHAERRSTLNSLREISSSWMVMYIHLINVLVTVALYVYFDRKCQQHDGR